MSVQKGLEATPAKPAEPTPAHPNWNVQNHEVLQQIKQDRAAHVENKTAAVQAQPTPHAEVRPPAAQPRAEVQPPVAQAPHSQVAQGQSTQRYERPATPAPQTSVVRPEVSQAPQVVQTNPANPQQIAQHQQRHVPNYNSGNLYGGLAAGALLGDGAAYYSGGDNYNNYAYGQNYDGSIGSTYGIDPASQFNQFNQYGQIGNPSPYADNSYLNDDSDQYLASNPNPSDNIYGGITYGGPQFDSGIVPPPIFGGYPPPLFGGYERDRNPIAAIPALFGNLIGGVLGAVTDSNRRRYYE
jgi:hypothetical protein